MAKPSAKSEVAHKRRPDLPSVLREAIVGAVRADGPDISARQLAILLMTAIEPQRQTVRGLALRLEVSTPAISRAIDRLVALALVRRLPDPSDGRSILLGQTRVGIAYVATLRRLMVAAAR